jgi:adenine/guanine/hypoxanthine permease
LRPREIFEGWQRIWPLLHLHRFGYETQFDSPDLSLYTPRWMAWLSGRAGCRLFCRLAVSRYAWATRGDINAFFGLMLDNLAVLTLMVGILAGKFGLPAEFALSHMVPGTVIGIIIGDLIYTWMAFRLARRSGRDDVTAMPLGLDTPSMFGMAFFVLGPSYVAGLETLKSPELAAQHTWHIGICAIVASGVFKLICSLGSGWVRRSIPRAGLLGSLAAVALVLISFLPLLEILRSPVVGMVSLAVILTTLVARIELPRRIPGALAALIVGAAIYYAMKATGTLGQTEGAAELVAAKSLWPTQWLEAFRFEWVAAWRDTIQYLPIVIPFALATVIGGIDCTESAAAAGDEYHTGRIIAVEAVATLAAGCCGGVIQSTPYIGHPAYKAMGGRAAYTLATAIFMGSAGLIGYFGYLYNVIPQPAVLPILVFVGLEITAQSFHATPVKHYVAVALACIPAMGALASLHVNEVLGDPAVAGHVIGAAGLSAPLAVKLHTLRILSNGFLVTSLLWASALAGLIDRRLLRAALYFAVAGVCTLFGVIHSPLSDGRLIVPWNLPPLPAAAAGQTPLDMAAGYFAVALLLALWGWYDTKARNRNKDAGHETKMQATDFTADTDKT